MARRLQQRYSTLPGRISAVPSDEDGKPKWSGSFSRNSFGEVSLPILNIPDGHILRSAAMLVDAHARGIAVDLRAAAETFQNTVGLDRLVDFAERSPYRDIYVSQYQKVIRSNQWPQSDSWILEFHSFVRRYERSACEYQEAASLVFDLLQDAPADPFELLDIAVLAEAARAREGKRSGIGLDHLQDVQICDLEALIGKVWTEDLGPLESVVDTLVQTLAASCSAAAELARAFNDYVDRFNRELTPGSVLRLDQESGGLVGAILSDFCGFSTTRFNQFLVRYRSGASQYVQRCLASDRRFEQVLALGEALAGRMDGEGAAAFGELTARITLLNFFNDHTDVKHSFKSWPGFLLWHAFAPALEAASPGASLVDIGHALAAARH